jgi:hypothetical protein
MRRALGARMSPICAMRGRNSGCVMAEATEAASRATIGAGVRAGASRPHQCSATRSMPCSRKVGVLGRSGSRLPLATPRPLMLLFCRPGAAVSMVVNITGTWPAATSWIAGPDPR